MPSTGRMGGTGADTYQEADRALVQALCRGVDSLGDGSEFLVANELLQRLFVPFTVIEAKRRAVFRLKRVILRRDASHAVLCSAVRKVTTPSATLLYAKNNDCPPSPNALSLSPLLSPVTDGNFGENRLTKPPPPPADLLGHYYKP